jgi:hypothetical protein
LPQHFTSAHHTLEEALRTHSTHHTTREVRISRPRTNANFLAFVKNSS